MTENLTELDLQFYQALFRLKSPIENVVVAKRDPSKESFLADEGYIEHDEFLARVKALSNQDKLDCYFCVAYTDTDRRKNENCKAISCIREELDFHGNDENIQTAEDELKRILPLMKKPTFIISSGRGYHLYWMLNERLEGKKATKALREFNRYFLKITSHGDPQIKNFSRILRCPGTINTKNGARCKVIEANPITYNFSDFENELKQGEVIELDVPLPDKIDLVDIHPEIIVDVLSPYWKDGSRHCLAFGLSGYLFKKGISESVALDIIKSIATKAKDSEIAERIATCKNVYSSAKDKQPGEIVGSSAIIEVLESHGVSKGGAIHLVGKLASALGVSFTDIIEFSTFSLAINTKKKKLIIRRNGMEPYSMVIPHTLKYLEDNLEKGLVKADSDELVAAWNFICDVKNKMPYEGKDSTQPKTQTDNKRALPEAEEMTEEQVSEIIQKQHLKLRLNLPEDHFITQYVKFESSRTDVYPEFLYLSALDILSKATRRKVVLPTAQEWIYPNLFIMKIAKSTQGRKSIDRNHKLDLCKACGYDNFAPTDGSPEALLKYAEEHPKCSIDYDEGARMLANVSNKPYMVDLRYLLTEIYDNRNLFKKLVNKEYRLKDPFINISLPIQPDPLAKHTSEEDLSSGLFPRFIISYPDYKKEKWLPFLRWTNELNENQNEIVERAKEIFNRYSEANLRLFEFGEEAYQVFVKWQSEMELEAENSNNPYTQAVVGRYAVYALKIAMLLDVGAKEPRHEITTENLIVSFDMIQNYFIPTYLSLVDLIKFDCNRNLQEKILGFIAKCGGRCGERELYKHLHVKKRDFEDAIDCLVLDSKEVRMIKERSGKRGTRLVYVLISDNLDDDCRAKFSKFLIVPIVPAPLMNEERDNSIGDNRDNRDNRDNKLKCQENPPSHDLNESYLSPKIGDNKKMFAEEDTKNPKVFGDNKDLGTITGTIRNLAPEDFTLTLADSLFIPKIADLARENNDYPANIEKEWNIINQERNNKLPSYNDMITRLEGKKIYKSNGKIKILNDLVIP